MSLVEDRKLPRFCITILEKVAIDQGLPYLINKYTKVRITEFLKIRDKLQLSLSLPLEPEEFYGDYKSEPLEKSPIPHFDYIQLLLHFEEKFAQEIDDPNIKAEVQKK